MSKTFYISTSIPYVNAVPHVGHALEFVQADVLARYHRDKEEDVFFLSGTDENALKNVQAAEIAGIETHQWVEKHAKIFINLLAKLNISNTDFVRTSSDNRHIDGAQKLWNACKKEDIYKKKYKGFYCVGCESFKTPKELVEGNCTDHSKQKIEEIEEENYFFKLSAYQKQLEDLISRDILRIIPESRKNEVLSFIRSGLEDFSISRSRERAKNWGIEVPGDKNQVMYVWVDALSNYINGLDYASGADNFNKYWAIGDKIAHLIGKDIIRFHAVYWPAILLSAGVRLPNELLVHGFFTIDGQKISKSIGNVVDPFEVIEKYGTDVVRYFLIREIPSGEDGDFSFAKLEERYNGDLANGLGNYTARVLTLAEKIGTFNNVSPDEKIKKEIEIISNDIENAINAFKLHEAISSIWKLISFGDKYINENKPWAKTVEDGSPERAEEARFRATKNEKVIYNALYILEKIAELLVPFMPKTSDIILSAIQYKSDSVVANKIPPLFPRL